MKIAFKSLLLLVISFSFTFAMEDNPTQLKKVKISSLKELGELEKNPQEITNLHLELIGKHIGDQGAVALSEGIKNLTR